jgi:hypothetical protein
LASKKKLKHTKRKKTMTAEKYAPAVVAFFRTAGVPVASEGPWIKISGRRALRPPQTRASNVNWDSVIDRIALGHCPDRLIDALRRNGALLCDDTKAYFVRERGAFQLRRGERDLALVRPTEARVEGQARMKGNFLIDGDHWAKLARAIERYERTSVEVRKPARPIEPPEPAPPSLIVVARAPEGLNEELVQACHQASASIRLERSVAYDHPVVLETADGTLKFMPISGPDHALRVNFVFHLNVGEARGRVDLFGTDDPLPVRLEPDTSEDVVPLAWAAALLGFAAVSCFTVVSRPPQSRSNGAKRLLPAFTRVSRRASVRHASSVPRRRFWPNHLEPTGAWVRHGPSFVPGHRRRLNDGRRASAEAKARACRVGITLAANETWVQPHTRGLPADADLTFRWSAPATLRSAARPVQT